MYASARNTTGATILNGRPVRITGGLGTNALVGLANGTGGVVGVATEDIPNNTTGRITTFGAVNDIDTSAVNDRDTIYASARSDERRDGKAWVRPGKYRWAPYC